MPVTKKATTPRLKQPKAKTEGEPKQGRRLSPAQIRERRKWFVYATTEKLRLGQAWDQAWALKKTIADAVTKSELIHFDLWGGPECGFNASVFACLPLVERVLGYLSHAAGETREFAREIREELQAGQAVSRPHRPLTVYDLREDLLRAGVIT